VVCEYDSCVIDRYVQYVCSSGAAVVGGSILLLLAAGCWLPVGPRPGLGASASPGPKQLAYTYCTGAYTHCIRTRQSRKSPKGQRLKMVCLNTKFTLGFVAGSVACSV